MAMGTHFIIYCVCMQKRTTIEIDMELLARARRALGSNTTRSTVEEALRRAAEAAEVEGSDRAVRQRAFFERLRDRVDLDVLRSEEMWR
jgi:Arc/MetJ family transcription regulator